MILEMKIDVPDVKGGRCISAEMQNGYILAKYEIGVEMLECRIDPSSFTGEWLDHKPSSRRQMETKKLYTDAKEKGRLHAFTCMKMDASVSNQRLLYQKGLPIKTGFSQRQWEKMLKDYNPGRNSRQMTRTEYVCRNLFLIQKLVESGLEISKAWESICDDSKNIGHYRNAYNPKNKLEPTGSREIVCGFMDLANVWKFIAEDPWEKTGGFWAAGGSYYAFSDSYPVADLIHNSDVLSTSYEGVGMIALD